MIDYFFNVWVSVMAEQPDIEELQLALDSEICGLTKKELIKVAEHVDVSTEELRTLQISRRISRGY